ncbi:MAG: Asp-tRNA(Asn)/Glu-tRNA(Gln) amidotransferase subunit GatB [Candidatus Peribacter sp.]|jgi:aspartyl-tRNA(Asn)/glutamyl-tRNA(Gln) amidotransferase subunit B|nr:Asp-tRNA(Asn)/Glu-tRNA(Gln) amidotransferase subunit GatB [Candidatus Peribacter sp.]MBT4393301.1 Asp-tRNA(Asn)/Glu-tRNA(Gln) amidotransferase subunit GatB [Candidatus Peribacter sp.]MBT4601196.1 Asp-tRNA(Asn)/Glu-tRNA(Gln) amidotransferase subunit GatB [Candidatus Peribacter sp.]MBT5148844.1 Asp-tRNA(Asn)/Glu-tRNA(Gln) amidotransferase subunit GatB [Candidatus Peribacter sp.]MBT5637276.1 Asp-tRNA(Asn)/Glu-tRNA(Gln) amidotransferase subunit GatB [Candidatus Peribacter sp.]
MSDLEVIIGLEVHAQMSTKTKMFCGCDNDAFGKQPNTTVCPICMGHPGTLPVPNATAIEKAIKASLAIGCSINLSNHFDRKHYFYPDLPMGFQISQYDFPLSSKGAVTYDMFDTSGNVTESKECGITRLHMENDAGKLTHKGSTTLCDYNRAGTPLMEIVTEPDLRSADEAVAFAQELRRILIAVKASEADMFKGMMRFDASISLREKGTEKLNPRSEIKNLNSFKSLERALQYEEKRLRKHWDTDGPLPGDITVGWIDDEGKTKMLRDKETADDYRYFPEPDIPPLEFDQKEIDVIAASLPKLPRELKDEYISLGLDEKQALQLIDQSTLQTMFEAIRSKTDAKRASSLVLTQLLGFLNAAEKEVAEGPDADAMLELVGKIDDGTISSNAGKDVLQKMVETGKNASTIIEAEGMQQISDDGAIEDLVQQAIDANPKAIEDYKGGNEKALGAIVGFVMKESKGQANPGKVNEILKKKI